MCVEAVLARDDLDVLVELEEYVARLPPVRATVLLRAGRARLAAERAYRRGDAAGAAEFESEAIVHLRSIGARPLLARARVERSRRHDDRGALAEARSIYAELGATRWLGRVDAASGLTA